MATYFAIIAASLLVVALTVLLTFTDVEVSVAACSFVSAPRFEGRVYRIVDSPCVL